MDVYYKVNKIDSMLERFHMTSRQPLVFRNNKTAALLVHQENPLVVELFSDVNAFFCSNKLA